MPTRHETKPTRSTQPCIPPRSINRVPTLIGWGEGGNVTPACVIPQSMWVPVVMRHVCELLCTVYFTCTGNMLTHGVACKPRAMVAGATYVLHQHNTHICHFSNAYMNSPQPHTTVRNKLMSNIWKMHMTMLMWHNQCTHGRVVTNYQSKKRIY